MCRPGSLAATGAAWLRVWRANAHLRIAALHFLAARTALRRHMQLDDGFHFSFVVIDLLESQHTNALPKHE